MELEANQAPHEFIYIDEAGFNLVKRRQRGRNVIRKRATVDVPGQRGANITMCAAIANAGLLLHRCQVGPYNTERLLVFLNDLHQRLVPEQDQEGENIRTFVITWDNVAFHHSQAITTWFEVHPRLVSLFLPPYSPFLNPIEEFFLHGGGRYMTISHMTRCPSLKPWMLAAGTSQLLIAKGGSDILGGFIPGASPWITSDLMLMKTCSLSLKIAEIRYSNFVLFLVPPTFYLGFLLLFFCSECSCVFHGYFVHCKQYCKTFSVLSYRVSTVTPVVNSKGKKNLFAFYWNAFECEHYCTCGHTVPNQEI